MSYDPQNIFGKILRGEAPAHVIYEDEHTFVMLDIMPQSPGHALVLTREPAATIFDMSPEAAAACIRTAKKVAHVLQDTLQPDGVMIGQFNGAAAGQTVPHVHFHVVPRHANSQLREHAREAGDPAELKALAERLRAALKDA